ncbi:MAG TPA: hypothetical protein VNY05_00115 [Candidatus Acidoferrales bacterium]|jgi:hypothetical protein|nr:hypothetical protein [Candidatus Acidoferrales bacterium]
MVDGLVETGGEEAGLQAGGAEHGWPGEGDALDGEEFLGVDGLVDGHGEVAEVGDFADILAANDGECGGGEAVFAGIQRGACLPSGERGPVEPAALVRLGGELS